MVYQLQPERPRVDGNLHPDVRPRGRGSEDTHRVNAHDHTSPAIVKDVDKCVDCGLCVDVCGEMNQNQNVYVLT